MSITSDLRLHTLIAVAAGVIGASCSSNPTPVRVGYLPMVSSLSHFVAVDQGYYASEGIVVEANPIKTSNLIAQDLVAGHIEVAIELSLVPLLKQLEASPKAAYVFSVSSITENNGFDAILVRPDSPLRQLCDLSRRRVGVFPGTTARQTLADVFASRCLAVPLPTFIELDAALHIQSLLSGDVDAVHTYEPTLALGRVKNGLRRLSPSIYAQQLSPNPIGVAAVNARWYDSDPRAARAVLRALDQAITFIEREPQAARAILAKATGIDVEVAKAMNIMPLSLSTKVDIESLRTYLGVLKRMGEIRIEPNADDLRVKLP